MKTEIEINEPEIPRYDIGRTYAPGDVNDPDELAVQNMQNWMRMKDRGEL